MNKSKNKNRTIIFRVTENIWQKAYNVSQSENKSVNDWAREEILSKLLENSISLSNEQFIQTELSNVRNLIETIMISQLEPTQMQANYEEALTQSLCGRGIQITEDESQTENENYSEPSTIEQIM